jgi:hypothetical protein
MYSVGEHEDASSTEAHPVFEREVACVDGLVVIVMTCRVSQLSSPASFSANFVVRSHGKMTGFGECSTSQGLIYSSSSFDVTLCFWAVLK